MAGQTERARRVLRHRRAGRRVAGLFVVSVAVGCVGALWGLEADAAAAEDSGSAQDSGSAPEPQRLTYGPIGPYDTLWSIARRVKPAGASIAQTMVALVRLNPEAFVDRNVHRIQGGYVLDLPTTAEALATPAADAQRIVSEQDANWEAFEQSAVPGESDLGEPARPDVVSRPETPPTESEVSVAGQPPAGREPPVTEGRLEAERQRLAAENAALLAEIDAAQGELEQARSRIETLGETVSQQEEEITALRKQVAQAPSAVPLLDVARSVPMMSWLVLGLVILLGVVALAYRRRRRRPLAESAAGEGSPPPAGDPAEAVDELPPLEEAYEEPVALPESPIPEPSLDDPGTERPPETDAAGGYTPTTKLNLARAYVNMGDEETAREVLEEVLAEGDDAERAAARELLEQLG